MMLVQIGLSMTSTQPLLLALAAAPNRQYGTRGYLSLANHLGPLNPPSSVNFWPWNCQRVSRNCCVVGAVGDRLAAAATSRAPAAQPSAAAPPEVKPGLYFFTEACQYFSAGVVLPIHGNTFIGTYAPASHLLLPAWNWPSLPTASGYAVSFGV